MTSRVLFAGPAAVLGVMLSPSLAAACTPMPPDGAVAVLSAPESAIAGTPVTLDASESLGARRYTFVNIEGGLCAGIFPVGHERLRIARYDWDFESDGIIDTSTTVPAVTHTYTSAGSVTARVVVHTDSTSLDTSSSAGPLSASATRTLHVNRRVPGDRIAPVLRRRDAVCRSMPPLPVFTLNERARVIARAHVKTASGRRINVGRRVENVDAGSRCMVYPSPGRKLRRGRLLVVTFVAVDQAGNRSKPHRWTFRRQ